MSESNERVAVQTYVPESQREIWRTEAERLDMSQAEYVRSMVQAGRRNFDLDRISRESEKPTSRDVTPGVDGLNDRVLAILREENYPSWEELVSELTRDVESDLDTALESLQDSNRIKYSGRHDGYMVNDDGR